MHTSHSYPCHVLTILKLKQQCLISCVSLNVRLAMDISEFLLGHGIMVDLSDCIYCTLRCKWKSPSNLCSSYNTLKNDILYFLD